MQTAPTDPTEVSAETRMSDRVIDAALSLKCKATALVVVLTLTVAAVVTGYLLSSTEELARHQHHDQLMELASVLANVAATPFEENDTEALELLADEAVNGRSLLYVIFSDVGGRQLAVAEREKVQVLKKLDRDPSKRVPVPGQPVFRDGTERVPVFLDVMYPVTAHRPSAPSWDKSPSATRGELLGYVRAGLLADEWHRTMASRMDLAIGVGVLAIVAAIPLGFLLVRRIVSPMDGLADMMHRFSLGELDVRSAVRRRDELGRLSTAFNRMADQHQQTHERIIRLNAELERRVAERTHQLRELASRDPLTGLYNRRHFNEMLERRFSEALRYKNELSCIMIDLDEFKNVNDEHGHQMGDEVLMLAARTISGELRTADVAARFGGDEFIILLPQTDLEHTGVLAQRIVERFASEIEQRFPQLIATMSMGLASVAAIASRDAETLVRASDRALYDAKAAGKNRIAVAGEPKPAVV